MLSALPASAFEAHDRLGHAAAIAGALVHLGDDVPHATRAADLSVTPAAAVDRDSALANLGPGEQPPGGQGGLESHRLMHDRGTSSFEETGSKVGGTVKTAALPAFYLLFHLL